MTGRREYFTATGGYVLQDHHDGQPVLAVASGEHDEGVALSDEDCLALGKWLLEQVLDRGEQVVLRGLLAMADHRLGLHHDYPEADPTEPF